MGISRLATFIKDKFTGWKPANFHEWDYIIIDGSNLCYSLHKDAFPWALGGEYDKFRDKIKDFFESNGFKHPIVVFDGTQYDLKKMETIRQRRTEYISRINLTQSQSNWKTDDGTNKVAPLLVIATFIATLKEMCIECYVADGEADKEIAALANHYKCPVLSSDSDFFVFNLTHGFIYFDRLTSVLMEEQIESLYNISELQSQYGLKQKEMCLLIPAVFGNDFVKVSEKSKKDYDEFLKELSWYHSCEDYLARSDNKIDRKDFEAVKKFYWDLPIPEYFKELPISKFAQLPKWVCSNFKKANFSVQLMDAFTQKTCVLPRVVEAISSDCAWNISQYIRERLYHIMGISGAAQVMEIVRINKTVGLTEELVPVVSLKQPVSLHDKFFQDEDERILSDLVLTILKCHELSRKDIKSDFNQLPDKLKLPIAATIYWYRSLHDPPSMRALVISLLISFLMCSEVLMKNDFPFKPVSEETKIKHLRALHAFAQWQCVYHDAMSLNYLAREPFPTTNPASLYSGNIAMHYAYESAQDKNWLDVLFCRKDSIDWKLFNRLLYLVTGEDEEGRAGKHAIKTGSVDNSWTVVK